MADEKGTTKGCRTPAQAWIQIAGGWSVRIRAPIVDVTQLRARTTNRATLAATDSCGCTSGTANPPRRPGRTPPGVPGEFLGEIRAAGVVVGRRTVERADTGAVIITASVAEPGWPRALTQQGG